MTMQIEDYVIYQNRPYVYIGSIPSGLFQPKEYGLEPIGMCFACYRGYYCNYKVANHTLRLDELVILDKNGNYPAINGVSVGQDDKFDGAKLYENLNLKVSFTGSIVLAFNCLGKYPCYEGNYMPWDYVELVEMKIENGRILRVMDRSEKAEKLRNIVDDCDDSFTQDSIIEAICEEGPLVPIRVPSCLISEGYREYKKEIIVSKKQSDALKGLDIPEEVMEVKDCYIGVKDFDKALDLMDDYILEFGLDENYIITDYGSVLESIWGEISASQRYI